MKLLGFLFSPLVFGLAFLAPLIGQSLLALNWQIAGVDTICVGLVIGGGLGLMAQIRGSWFWVR
ncbi:MAG TPA: hypothetical protein DHU16_02735 [Gammaproteobacteria bacterium]|nr:hypothetical protein [Gammaproteobacteria bacterium]HCY04342.1 hypothetical protein [Gammaproteobacteria bacterium]